MIPVQNAEVQNFMTFCVIGIQVIAYPIIMLLLLFFRNAKNMEEKNEN